MASENRNRRRSRSRSPMRQEKNNDRNRRRDIRDSKSSEDLTKLSADTTKMYDMSAMSAMNPMMMSNMLAQQGNMMMAGGMYPGNMMMPGAMMGGGMMATNGMEMITATGMDMIGQSQMDVMNTPMGSQAMAGATGGMDMSMMGGMMMDPSMMGMGMYSQMGTEMSMPVQENKEIELKSCKLTPPLPGATQPPRRSRPAGCRTIFVGGLPDRIKEEIVRDIFERYGRIYTLRLSKKNFCHIRYDRENSVDAAMRLSGFRLKLTDKEDDDEETHANAGWLHVDYALSRDDQNEHERRQKQVLRVQQAQQEQMSNMVAMESPRRQQRSQRSRRSPSPVVRIHPFSNATIGQLSEKIKTEEHFASSVPTLVAWLERGECSKKNATTFYSMIQATNAQIRRLFNEKIQHEEELQDCKERVKTSIQKIILQLEQVAKVLNAATHQRVWDHFTKAQRKNIETWQKMTEEFNSLKEEYNDKFDDEDNELSDNNYNKQYNTGSNSEVTTLKQENENLQFQLEAYKNEVDVIKADQMKELEKFKAQFIARQALNSAMGDMKSFQPPPPTIAPAAKPPPPPPLPEEKPGTVVLSSTVDRACGEARLIGVMSAFLQVHPHGASLDYVVSYVRALFPEANQATIHHVLQKHSDVFQRSTSGVGANIEHRWAFVAFTPKQEIIDNF